MPKKGAKSPEDISTTPFIYMRGNTCLLSKRSKINICMDEAGKKFRPVTEALRTSKNKDVRG